MIYFTVIKSGFNFTEYILYKITHRRVRMGCKQSKLGGRIQPVGPASVKKDNTKRTRGEFDIEYKTGKKIRKTKSQNSKLFGSSVSLDDDRSLADSERGFSASSKFSKKSGDSGLEADYGFIITEDSDPDKVRKIEEEFNQDENLGKIVSYFRHRFCIIKYNIRNFSVSFFF